MFFILTFALKISKYTFTNHAIKSKLLYNSFSTKPKTYKLEKKEDKYIFHDDPTLYLNINELKKAYSNPDKVIYLKECLPPSEYGNLQSTI